MCVIAWLEDTQCLTPRSPGAASLQGRREEKGRPAHAQVLRSVHTGVVESASSFPHHKPQVRELRDLPVVTGASEAERALEPTGHISAATSSNDVQVGNEDQRAQSGHGVAASHRGLGGSVQAEELSGVSTYHLL